MNTVLKKVSAVFVLLLIVGIMAAPFTAETVRAAGNDTSASSSTTTEETADSSEDSATGDKAMAAAIAIGLGALGGAIAMGIAISKSSEGISRQPEAGGQIRTTLMLGLVFIETAIIYALVVAILIIFVL
ncbi:MAG: ATP synthase F0 subunit C [Bilifractor sp.]|jgi:F-type H+-transporting ATPase subunit c